MMNQPELASIQKQNQQQQLDRAESLQYSAPVQALALANEVLSLLQGRPEFARVNKQNMVRCLAIIARCHIGLSNYAAAALVSKQAIELGETISYTPYLGIAYSLVGFADTRMGNYVDALRTFLEQEQKAIAHNDWKGIAAAYTGRALIYSFTGEFERAIAYDEEGLRIAQECGDEHRHLIHLNNLCWDYVKLEKPERALQYGLQGLALNEEQKEDSSFNLLNINVGIAYLRLGNTEEGQKHLSIGLTQACLTGDLFSEMKAHLEYGRYYLALQQPEKAVSCLEQALQHAMQQHEKIYHYETHKLLSEAHKVLDNPHKALAHFEQFYTIRESLLNQQNQIRLATIEFEHELELAQRKAESSTRLAADLEDQVREHTADLQAALARETELSRKLEQALENESKLQELKTRIINTASHEFRTPLSIIDLTTNLLSKRIGELSKDEVNTYRKRISSQVFYLKEMIQDVLTVNTSTSINPIYRSYHFDEFCRHLQNNLATELQGIERIAIHHGDCEQLVDTDLDLVQRVVLNLITNALKFSEPNMSVELKIECSHDVQQITIRVSDYGIGIPLADLPHIFTMFYRAGNISTQSGLGLGLSVVHKIVSALRGTIVVESTVLNEGSTFCVTLPLRPLNE